MTTGNLIDAFGISGFDPELYDYKKPEKKKLTYSQCLNEISELFSHYGLILKSLPVINGEIQRIKHKSDKKGKSGWYVFREDEGIIFGSYGSWKDPDSVQTWSSINTQDLDPNELKDFHRRLEKLKAEAENKQRILWDEAEVKATEFLLKLKQAENHPYLDSKKISATDGVFINHSELIIPVINEFGKIRSYQSINYRGDKLFMEDGQVQACFHEISGSLDVVLICEGYATGVSLYSASGYTVYCAFNCGNLNNVAQIVKRKHEGSKVVVCADNDRFTNNNPGIKKGADTASKNGFLLTHPIFPESDTDSTDFNDLHQKYGLDCVKQALGINTYSKPLEIYSEENKDDVFDDKDSYLLNPLGVLKDIASYFNQTARMPQPEFAIQTGLAVLSTALGRRFVTDYENYPTLYFLNIARSGTGKEHVKTVIERILDNVGMGYLIAGSGYTSAGAVFSTLLSKPSHITVIDEIGKYMEASKNKGNLNQRAANTIIMESIGRCGGAMRPQSYSQMTNIKQGGKLIDRVIYNPAMCIVGLTTPSTFYDNISKEQISDGFLGRFILSINDRPRQKARDFKKVSVPDSIIKWFESINQRYNDIGDLQAANVVNPDERPFEIELTFSESAKQWLDEFDDEMIDLINSLESKGISDLANRAREFSMRLSLIVALSRNPYAETIEDSDVKYSIEYIRTSVNKSVKAAEEHIVETEYERYKNEILTAIRKSPEGITNREMARRSPFRKHPAYLLNNIIADLMNAELIDNRDLSELRKSSRGDRPRGPKPMGYIAVTSKYE